MQIAFLTGEYPPDPGGVGDYTQHLVQALSARNHTITVLTIRERQLLQIAGDTCSVLAQRCDWSPRSWPAIRAALRQIGPDWLHLQYQTGAFAMQAGINLLPWRLRQQRERPRIAVTFHDLREPYLFPKAGPLRRWITLHMARSADLVIATNPVDAADLRSVGISAQRIPIGSNIPVAPPDAYERSAWRTQLGVAPNEILIAYFGLLSATKGVDRLINALRDLPDLPWRLLLIGGAATSPQDRAYAAQINSLLHQYQLAARVIRTGHVQPTEVSAHLLAADFAVLPFDDGASLRRGSLLAVLAHGCPLITTTPGDLATARDLPANQAALLIPPADPTALRNAIMRLAHEPTLRTHLAHGGSAVAERFRWPTIAATHEACYSESFGGYPPT
jgi:glycosyltransferase involved in cell wall biosynthesis